MLTRKHFGPNDIAQMMTSGSLLTGEQEIGTKIRVLNLQIGNIRSAVTLLEEKLPELQREKSQLEAGLAQLQTEAGTTTLTLENRSSMPTTGKETKVSKRRKRGESKSAAILDFLAKNGESTILQIHRHLIELNLASPGNDERKLTMAALQGIRRTGRHRISSRRESDKGSTRVYFLEKDDDKRETPDDGESEEFSAGREISRAGPGNPAPSRKRQLKDAYKRALIVTGKAHSPRSRSVERDDPPANPSIGKLKSPNGNGDDWQTMILAILSNNLWGISWRELDKPQKIKEEARIVGFDLSTAPDAMIHNKVKETLELLERKQIIARPSTNDEPIQRAEGGALEDTLAPEEGRPIRSKEDVGQAMLEGVERYPLKWSWDDFSRLLLAHKRLGRNGWFFPETFPDGKIESLIEEGRKSLNGEFGKDEENRLFLAKVFPVLN